MPWFPDEPDDLPAAQRAEATAWVRYEDVAQDGRVTVIGLPPLTGPSVWGPLLTQQPILRSGARTGIVPILSRVVAEGLEGPISVGKPLTVSGSYQMGHTVDERGVVNRLVLNTWVRATGPRARMHGPPPPDAGVPIVVGRVYGESVFTRPFAPPGARKVLRFDGDPDQQGQQGSQGTPAIPPHRHIWRRPEDNLVLPAGAVALDDDLAPDDVPVHFGLCHTDSNQHVNSLVYPRLFEEATLRRLARHGHATRLLARYFDIAYRKPCFAGDRVRIRLRAFILGDHVGAAGCYVPDYEGGNGADSRPYCYITMLLSP